MYVALKLLKKCFAYSILLLEIKLVLVIFYFFKYWK